MDWLFACMVGLGLSAACGFRVFLPMFVVGFAAITGHMTLSPAMAWIGSDAAVICFGFATFCEIIAYYTPWVDNLLDSIATPAAIVAGILVTGAIDAEMSPFLHWSVAVIAGGGSAAVVQIGSTAVRQASLLTTGGLGNPVVSTMELGGSVSLVFLALLAPLIGLILVFALIWLAYKAVARTRLFRAPVPAS